jgi:hypothetical protein
MSVDPGRAWAPWLCFFFHSTGRVHCSHHRSSCKGLDYDAIKAQVSANLTTQMMRVCGVVRDAMAQGGVGRCRLTYQTHVET